MYFLIHVYSTTRIIAGLSISIYINLDRAKIIFSFIQIYVYEYIKRFKIQTLVIHKPAIIIMLLQYREYIIAYVLQTKQRMNCILVLYIYSIYCNAKVNVSNDDGNRIAIVHFHYCFGSTYFHLIRHGLAGKFKFSYQMFTYIPSPICI